MLDKIKRFAVKNKFFNLLIIIAFRISGLLISLLYILLRILPLKDKVVCINMKGKRYGDNPKYITNALLDSGYKGEIVWLFRDPDHMEVPVGVRKAKYNILTEIYETATAKVWIDSNLKWYGTRKRKGQIYIQTWHGSYGLKKIQGDIPDKISYFDRVIYKHNSKIIDQFVTNSDMTTEIYKRAFEFDGRIVQCGSPRNDVFFRDSSEAVSKVLTHFGIQGKKTVLYAPTYRNHFTTSQFDLDYDRLIRTLEERFGGEWVILIRMHPQNMLEAAKFVEYNDRIINATDYPDMQELLVACDILISDYSSCMFDFVTDGKTCLIYASDIEAYRQERDYYFSLEELPFPVASDNDQMELNIRSFDEEKYASDLKSLFDRVGLSESGHASDIIAKQIIDFMENNA